MDATMNTPIEQDVQNLPPDWEATHIDAQAFYGNVQTTIKERRSLWAQRGQHLLSDMSGDMTFICGGAKFVIAGGLATQTSAILRQQRVLHVCEAEFEHTSPYIVDRLIEFWCTFTLNVSDDKKLRHHVTPPTDASQLDVTHDLSTMDALWQISKMGYMLEDQALINAAYCCMRSRIAKGRLGPLECVRSIIHVYSDDTDGKHKGTQRGILLAGAIRLRSEFLSPGFIGNAFKKALEYGEFRIDWENALKWCAGTMDMDHI